MILRNTSRVLALTALVFAPAAARAQSGDSAVAQALFDDAKVLLADGHAVEACPKLEESQRLDPRSGTLINLASCYEQTGRLASAWGRYIDAATAAKASGNPEREAVARERAAALAPRLSKLLITVAPVTRSLQGLELTRDGVALGVAAWGAALPSDAGEHQVVAKAPGYAPFQTKVAVVGEGKTTTLNVPELTALASTQPPTTEPPPPPTSHGLGSMRVAALVAGGVGVVGVGLGTAFGLASKAKHDEANKYCSGAACTDSRGVTAGDTAQTDGNISTIAMIVGGVGLAAGVTLWLTAPKRNSDSPGAPAASIGFGFGSVQVKGAF